MIVTTFDRVVFLIIMVSLVAFAWQLTLLWRDLGRRQPPQTQTIDTTRWLLAASVKDGIEMARLASQLVFLGVMALLSAFTQEVTWLWLDAWRRLRPPKRTVEATVRLLGMEGTELAHRTVWLEESSPQQYRATSHTIVVVTRPGIPKYMELDCPSLGWHKKQYRVTTDAPRDNCIFLHTEFLARGSFFYLTNLTLYDEEK